MFTDEKRLTTCQLPINPMHFSSKSEGTKCANYKGKVNEFYYIQNENVCMRKYQKAETSHSQGISGSKGPGEGLLSTTHAELSKNSEKPREN